MYHIVLGAEKNMGTHGRFAVLLVLFSPALRRYIPYALENT